MHLHLEEYVMYLEKLRYGEVLECLLCEFEMYCGRMVEEYGKFDE